MTTYFNPPSVIGLVNGEATGMAVDFMLDKLYDRRAGVQQYYGTPWAAAGGPVQFSRAGNATVVDKDGKIKWAGHNLLAASESFDNASWTKAGTSFPTITANAATSPDGKTTADQLAFAATSVVSQFSSVSGAAAVTTANDYTASVWLRTVSGTATVYIQAFGSAYSTAVACSVTTTWQLFSVTFTGAAGTSYFNIGPDARTGSGQPTAQAAATVYAWGASLYRSDLGGMVDNPNPVMPGAVSYYPTTTAPYYAPRLDHDATGKPLGLLIEEQRTNLLTHSAEFDVTWSNVVGVVNVTANTAVAPDGTSTADKLVPAAATSYMVKRQPVTTTAASHTFSVYGKESDSGYHLELFTVVRGADVGAVFNLSTGAVLGSANCTTVVSSPDANGWRRYCITFIANAGATNLDVRVATASTINQSMTGDGSAGIFAWGAQLEVGAFATSYIPTTTASATRSADVASMPTTAFPYNYGSGTIIVNTRLIGLMTTAAQRAITLANTNNDSIHILANNTAGSRDAIIVSGGATQGYNNLAGATTASDTRQGFAFATNDTAHAVNGASPRTDNTVVLPASAAVKLIIGLDTFNGVSLNGHIRQVTYIPRRIANEDLQERTAV
jgi:hypothetical protein